LKLTEYLPSDAVKRFMIKFMLLVFAAVLLAGCTTECKSGNNEKPFTSLCCQPLQDASFQALPSDISAAEMAGKLPRGEQLLALMI
jgi:hypothetical protein